jgi:hypothetical protein
MSHSKKVNKAFLQWKDEQIQEFKYRWDRNWGYVLRPEMSSKQIMWYIDAFPGNIDLAIDCCIDGLLSQGYQEVME